MCHMKKYLDLDLADLRHVCVGCSCGARFVLDLANKNLRTPASCNSCGVGFDFKAMQEPLANLKEIYRMFSDSPSKVTFQVPVRDVGDEK